jgi:hypothetical protein
LEYTGKMGFPSLNLTNFFVKFGPIVDIKKREKRKTPLGHHA